MLSDLQTKAIFEKIMQSFIVSYLNPFELPRWANEQWRPMKFRQYRIDFKRLSEMTGIDISKLHKIYLDAVSTAKIRAVEIENKCKKCKFSRLNLKEEIMKTRLY